MVRGDEQPRLPFEVVPVDMDAAIVAQAPVAPPHAPRVLSPERPAAGQASPVRVTLVRHARARRYIIRVDGDGTVRVTMPRRGSQREALAFVNAQRGWIAAQLHRVHEARATRPPGPSAETQRQLRARALQELPARLHALAAQAGLTVRKVTIRNQRRRWGSCTTDGHISLNWRLVAMPPAVRDYVLWHELMHLRRMDHSPEFWRLVAAVCPDFQNARRWLSAHAWSDDVVPEAGAEGLRPAPVAP